MPVKGSAELTDHLSTAVTPDMKNQVKAAAKRYGVAPAVIARWAIEEWLTNNAADDSTGTEES